MRRYYSILLLILAALQCRLADAGFFMMMKKPENDGAKMMESSTDAASSDDSGTAPKGAASTPECISSDQLAEAVQSAQTAQAALDEALQQVADAETAMEQARASERQALEAQQESQKALQDAQEQMDTLRTRLEEQQQSSSDNAIDAAALAQYQQDILRELSDLNAGSAQQFQALQGKLDAEMQRQREHLRVDQVTAERVAQLEKENMGYLGELKALHQLYNRLDQKYDAKMQEEEDEKLAYFAKSLDQEVAKIMGEREMEWEQTVAELRAQLEEEAKQKAERMEELHQKEIDIMNKMIADIQVALADAEQRAIQTEADMQLTKQKELEKAEERTLERLAQLQQDVKANAAKRAVAVQKAHDSEIAKLRAEIRQAQDETKRAEEKSKQIDSSLKSTEEEREKQKEKYEEIIAGLKNELHEAHEETAYWMKAFAKRAYFNATQLGGDIVMFAEEAQFFATEKANTVLSQTRTLVKQQSEQLGKAVDPYTRPVGEFYQAHLSQHVNAAGAAVQPVYDRNVAPVVKDVQLFGKQKSDELWTMWNETFDETVSMAQKQCKMHRKQIDASPSVIRDSARRLCEDPATVIEYGLRALLLILLIVFRRVIWNIILGTIRLVFRGFWYLITFRFLRSSKPSPPVDVKIDGETTESAAQ